MATITVRKFAISLDPEEIVDFTEPLDHFIGIFGELGFEQTGTYTFRHQDPECMLKAELQRSKDGYYLWVYVQAQDEHEYRIREVAEHVGGYVIDGGKRPV